jgi:hypothetical protein
MAGNRLTLIVSYAENKCRPAEVEADLMNTSERGESVNRRLARDVWRVRRRIDPVGDAHLTGQFFLADLQGPAPVPLADEISRTGTGSVRTVGDPPNAEHRLHMADAFPDPVVRRDRP